MTLKEISKSIKYIPAVENPLSAEVFLVEKNGQTFIFDVGSDDRSLEVLNSITTPRSIVISHFHEDHFGNIKRLELRADDKVYGGDFTCRKFADAVKVDAFVWLSEGIGVFPLPSTHSKGGVGMIAEGYVFLGDGTYGTVRNGEHVYNTSLLHETIATLEKLSDAKFVLSHHLPEIRNGNDVVNELKQIYAKRKNKEAYIVLT